VKQPLQELKVKSDKLKGEKEILETLAEEVNVKKISCGAKIKEAVELDTEITAGLRAEGQLREFTRLVQGLRQNAGYKLGEAVNLYVEAGEFNKVVSRHLDWVKGEISAKSIDFKIPEKYDAKTETKIDSYSVSVAVKK